MCSFYHVSGDRHTQHYGDGVEGVCVAPDAIDASQQWASVAHGHAAQRDDERVSFITHGRDGDARGELRAARL